MQRPPTVLSFPPSSQSFLQLTRCIAETRTSLSTVILLISRARPARDSLAMPASFISRRAIRSVHAVRLTVPAQARCFATTSLRCSPASTSPRSSSTTATQPHPKPPSASFHPSKQSIFTPLDTFLPRHVGPRDRDVDEMLQTLGYKSMDEFVDAAIPTSVRVDQLKDVDGPGGIRPLSELELRRRVEEVAGLNKPMKSYIGMG